MQNDHSHSDGLPTLHFPRALQHLHTRLLLISDADKVLSLRRSVLQTMNPALRAVDPERGCAPDVEKAWADKHLGPRAHTLGVFQGDTLQAFACLLLADEQDPQDPGHLMGLTGGEWGRAAHMAACMVNEDYRGLNLQSRLLKWRRQVAVSQQHNLLMAMTACGNTYSRRNLLDSGLGIHWVGEWRPGSWWHGLKLDLAVNPLALDDGQHEWVSASDVEHQRRLIAQGYVGVAEMSSHGVERRVELRLQFVHRRSAVEATNPAVIPPTECVQ